MTEHESNNLNDNLPNDTATSLPEGDEIAAEQASADDKPVYRRGIKSFVIRAGRLTKGQEQALERKRTERSGIGRRPNRSV